MTLSYMVTWLGKTGESKILLLFLNKVLNVSNLNCIMNYDDQNIGNDYNNTTFYIVLSDRFVR